MPAGIERLESAPATSKNSRPWAPAGRPVRHQGTNRLPQFVGDGHGPYRARQEGPMSAIPERLDARGPRLTSECGA